MTEALRPMPVATDATRPFWDAAHEHRLLIQQCGSCGKPQFYPRPFCRHCMADAPAWIACSGLATIYTYTVNHRAANAHMADQLPYVVAVVTLDEGVRMVANIVDCAIEDVRIGARVQVCWLDTPGQPTIPQFKPIAA